MQAPKTLGRRRAPITSLRAPPCRTIPKHKPRKARIAEAPRPAAWSNGPGLGTTRYLRGSGVMPDRVIRQKRPAAGQR